MYCACAVLQSDSKLFGIMLPFNLFKQKGRDLGTSKWTFHKLSKSGNKYVCYIERIERRAKFLL